MKRYNHSKMPIEKGELIESLIIKIANSKKHFPALMNFSHMALRINDLTKNELISNEEIDVVLAKLASADWIERADCNPNVLRFLKPVVQLVPPPIMPPPVIYPVIRKRPLNLGGFHKGEVEDLMELIAQKFKMKEIVAILNAKYNVTRSYAGYHKKLQKIRKAENANLK